MNLLLCNQHWIEKFLEKLSNHLPFLKKINKDSEIYLSQWLFWALPNPPVCYWLGVFEQFPWIWRLALKVEWHNLCQILWWVCYLIDLRIVVVPQLWVDFLSPIPHGFEFWPKFQKRFILLSHVIMLVWFFSRVKICFLMYR